MLPAQPEVGTNHGERALPFIIASRGIWDVWRVGEVHGDQKRLDVVRAKPVEVGEPVGILVESPRPIRGDLEPSDRLTSRKRPRMRVRECPVALLGDDTTSGMWALASNKKRSSVPSPTPNASHTGPRAGQNRVSSLRRFPRPNASSAFPSRYSRKSLARGERQSIAVARTFGAASRI